MCGGGTGPAVRFILLADPHHTQFRIFIVFVFFKKTNSYLGVSRGRRTAAQGARPTLKTVEPTRETRLAAIDGQLLRDSFLSFVWRLFFFCTCRWCIARICDEENNPSGTCWSVTSVVTIKKLADSEWNKETDNVRCLRSMNSTSNYSISLLSFQLAVCCIRVVVDGRSHFRYVRQIIIIQLCRATTWHKNEKCLSVDTCSRFPYRGEKKRKKKKQRRLRQPYWPRQQSLITGCRGLYCSDEHEIRPEMRSPRLYSDDRVIMIIDVTDGSIFCTICVFNRFFSFFF